MTLWTNLSLRVCSCVFVCVLWAINENIERFQLNERNALHTASAQLHSSIFIVYSLHWFLSFHFSALFNSNLFLSFFLFISVCKPQSINWKSFLLFFIVSPFLLALLCTIVQQNRDKLYLNCSKLTNYFIKTNIDRGHRNR